MEKSILEHCAEFNTFEFNSNKALEEASEFMEALLKYQTKAIDNPKRPSREEILKEYADFQYRGKILLMSLFPELKEENIEKMIEDHKTMKLNKLEFWRRSSKYKNGL